MDISLEIYNRPNNSMTKKHKRNNEIEKIANISVFSNTKNEPIITEDTKTYINTQNDIFKDNNNQKNKKFSQKINLFNFENLINGKISYFSYKEQNIIRSFFESMKSRSQKKETMNNKTVFGIRDRNPFTKKIINYNYTNSEGLKLLGMTDNLYRKKNITVPKKYRYYFNENKNHSRNLYNSRDNSKYKNNLESIKFPNIKIVKNNFKTLMSKVNDLNNNIEKIKIDDNTNELKLDDIIIKKPSENDNKIDETIFNEETRANFLKNKKHLKDYIIKLSKNFKYKNNSINRFLKKKEMENNKNYNLATNNEKDEFFLNEQYKERTAKNKMELLKKNRKHKYKIKSNIDKDIFKIFNKKI
jgi:hypothetical protein